MNVMVVDGSAEQRELVVDALGELTNFVVRGAARDIGTLMRLLDEQQALDLVVTEARLPDGDCADVVSAVRRRLPRASVIVFSDLDEVDQQGRCLDAGADLYLPKRAGAQALQRCVVDLVGQRAGRRPHADDRFALLGRLTAGVAHDLNNYLAVVELALSMVQRRLDAGALRDGVAEAQRAVESATRLVTDLIAYARGGAPTPTMVDLGALLRRVLDLFGRTVPDHITVVVDVEPDLPQVRGVAIELEQLVVNLVLNACDAMPHGGELRLSVVRDGAAVRLDVADRGNGLHAEAVFGGGPFASSAKIGRNGNGLGLGIVRSVADRHGATLRFIPRAGGGTRVSVLVPAEPGA